MVPVPLRVRSTLNPPVVVEVAMVMLQTPLPPSVCELQVSFPEPPVNVATQGVFAPCPAGLVPGPHPASSTRAPRQARTNLRSRGLAALGADGIDRISEICMRVLQERACGDDEAGWRASQASLRFL